jgi:hypothetical protein
MIQLLYLIVYAGHQTNSYFAFIEKLNRYMRQSASINSLHNKRIEWKKKTHHKYCINLNRIKCENIIQISVIRCMLHMWHFKIILNIRPQISLISIIFWLNCRSFNGFHLTEEYTWTIALNRSLIYKFFIYKVIIT